jgi:hypothetical protein
MSSLNMPRDETETEEDPFADEGSGSENEGRKEGGDGSPARINVHALSTDDDAVTGEESEEETNMDTDHAGGGGDGLAPIPPLSASTPTRAEEQPFRIVDIVCSTSFKNPGDANSAEGCTGDANTANTSDANSADANPRNCNAGSTQTSAEKRNSDSGSKDLKPGSSKKVPAMVKPPPKKPPPKIPAEADATPSPTYVSIVLAKKNKMCPPVIPGTGTHNVDYSCGSFYNKGDNRVARTVYKENVANLNITSMSFNPTNWICSACPKKHPILGGGLVGAGEGGAPGHCTGGSELPWGPSHCNWELCCHCSNRTWQHEGIG